MRRVRPRDHTARADRSQRPAAQADQSTDPCALKAKSLEQGLPRKPARQKREADEPAKTRLIRRSLSLRLCAVPPSDFQKFQECCAVQTASERIGMAVCPDVICNKGEFVLVIRIGDLPMGSGTLGLQCCGRRFYPLPDHIRTNGSSGDPTDQALKKPLKFKILA